MLFTPQKWLSGPMLKSVSLLTSAEIGMKNTMTWEGIEMHFGIVLQLELMKDGVQISRDTIVKKSSGVLSGITM
jgi:hypothetical protein